MNKKTYTIAQLLALPDDDLNALAAELRGWHWLESDLVDEKGEAHVLWPVCWTPVTDCNQSRELLTWAATQHSVRFCTTTGMGIYSGVAQIDERGFEIWGEIPGASAHSETVAFCAAILAQQGKPGSQPTGASVWTRSA